MFDVTNPESYRHIMENDPPEGLDLIHNVVDNLALYRKGGSILRVFDAYKELMGWKEIATSFEDTSVSFSELQLGSVTPDKVYRNLILILSRVLTGLCVDSTEVEQWDYRKCNTDPVSLSIAHQWLWDLEKIKIATEYKVSGLAKTDKQMEKAFNDAKKTIAYVKLVYAELHEKLEVRDLVYGEK